MAPPRQVATLVARVLHPEDTKISEVLDELDSLSETPSSEKGSTLPVPLFAIYRGDELQCVNSSHARKGP